MKNSCVNLFEIKNVKQLSFDYKLLEISGLAQGEDFEKNIGILKRKLAFELRKPVTHKVKGEKHYIVIPYAAKDPEYEQKLIPHIVKLIPENVKYPLTFEKATVDEYPIIGSFLEYQIKSTLWNNQNIWQPSSGKTYYWKNPRNANDSNRDIDIFSGFSYNIVIHDQRIFLSIDLATKYVDRTFLVDYLKIDTIQSYLHKNFIYHYGNRWYQITLSGDPKRSIKDHFFIDARNGARIDVYSYIQQNVQPKTDLIKNLDPNSPVILYSQPGKKNNLSAAAALCKQTFKTDDPRVKPLHYRSIQKPAQRFTEIIKDIKEIFKNSKYAEIPLEIQENPLIIPSKQFEIPAQLFGHDYLIHTKKSNEIGGVALFNLGKERLNALQNANIGIFSDFPFDPQYLLIPSTLPREVSDDFKDRIIQTLQKFSKFQYSPQKSTIR